MQGRIRQQHYSTPYLDTRTSELALTARLFCVVLLAILRARRHLDVWFGNTGRTHRYHYPKYVAAALDTGLGPA
jgi:hypothetical protein